MKNSKLTLTHPFPKKNTTLFHLSHSTAWVHGSWDFFVVSVSPQSETSLVNTLQFSVFSSVVIKNNLPTLLLIFSNQAGFPEQVYPAYLRPVHILPSSHKLRFCSQTNLKLINYESCNFSNRIIDNSCTPKCNWDYVAKR